MSEALPPRQTSYQRYPLSRMSVYLLANSKSDMRTGSLAIVVAVAVDRRDEPELRGAGDADGHRKRLRQRFRAETGETLTDAELLELLLCFAIPRKDVRALAELLLQRFGSLPCTLAAGRHDLQAIDGLGDASIALIKLVECMRQRVLVSSAETHDGPVDGQQLQLFTAPARLLEPVEADEVQCEPPPVESPPTAPPARRPQRRAIAPRHGTELFAKAALKEAVALLPTLPDTDDLGEIGQYLRQALPFRTAQTRSRNADYIIRRMFPQGYADRALRLFARQYAVCSLRVAQSGADHEGDGDRQFAAVHDAPDAG